MAGMPWGGGEELPKETSAWATVFFISAVHNPKGRTSPGVQKERMWAPEGGCRVRDGQWYPSLCLHSSPLSVSQCFLRPVCWECGPHSVMPLLESVW